MYGAFVRDDQPTFRADGNDGGLSSYGNVAVVLNLGAEERSTFHCWRLVCCR